MSRTIRGIEYLTVAEVAKHVGVHRVTLLRWIKAGKVGDGLRDRHGWRLFNPEQVAEIREFAFTADPPTGVPVLGVDRHA